MKMSTKLAPRGMARTIVRFSIVAGGTHGSEEDIYIIPVNIHFVLLAHSLTVSTNTNGNVVILKHSHCSFVYSLTADI